MTKRLTSQTKARIARIAVGIVFALNISCALQFICAPQMYVGAFELSGFEGNAAIQGLGVAFLMWNVTYPLVILNPQKYRTLFALVLVQQLIGLAGETLILLSLPPDAVLLSASITRFIIFDAGGLIIMSLGFVLLRHSSSR